MPADMRSGTSRAAGEESALASLARDMAASQAGSRYILFSFSFQPLVSFN